MKKSESGENLQCQCHPPLAQSTNSFKSEVGGGVAAQSKPALIERCLQLKQFLRIKHGQSKQEFPTRDLRTWSNSKGKVVFGFNLLDESDEIKSFCIQQKLLKGPTSC